MFPPDVSTLCSQHVPGPDEAPEPEDDEAEEGHGVEADPVDHAEANRGPGAPHAAHGKNNDHEDDHHRDQLERHHPHQRPRNHKLRTPRSTRTGHCTKPRTAHTMRHLAPDGCNQRSVVTRPEGDQLLAHTSNPCFYVFFIGRVRE